MNSPYPAGAANDPNAPWNLVTCTACGYDVTRSCIEEDGICSICIENADQDSYCEIET